MKIVNSALAMISLRYLWYIQVQVSKRQLGIMRKKPGMEVKIWQLLIQGGIFQNI